ncbi:MAG: TerC family protein [Cyanobacteria bacterium P01_A01_bin.3]
MDTISLDLLNDILRSLEWSDLLAIGALVLLEAALSADNAVALAAMVRHLETEQERDRALRWGIVGAYSFRIVVILAATWIISYWPAKLAGALYLFYLTIQHFRDKADDELETIPRTANFWQTIVLVELTDIAFSLDSIAASIAVSSKVWVIILGGLIGITLMRYMASLFVNWLEDYARLEDAAYFMIALVASRMVIELATTGIEIPEWGLMVAIGALFVWGFSKRSPANNSDSESTIDAKHPMNLQVLAAEERQGTISEAEPFALESTMAEPER